MKNLPMNFPFHHLSSFVLYIYIFFFLILERFDNNARHLMIVLKACVLLHSTQAAVHAALHECNSSRAFPVWQKPNLHIVAIAYRQI